MYAKITIIEVTKSSDPDLKMQKQMWNNQNKFLAAKNPFSPHRVSMFFEEVASQIGIAVTLQHLLYLGTALPLEGNMKVVNLPRTSHDKPFILLSDGPEASTSLPFRERKTIKTLHRRYVSMKSKAFPLI